MLELVTVAGLDAVVDTAAAAADDDDDDVVEPPTAVAIVETPEFNTGG